MSKLRNSPVEIINFTGTSSDVDFSFVLITVETAVPRLAALKHNVLTQQATPINTLKQHQQPIVSRILLVY